MKVMTCNIRCSTAGDGDDGWTFRKDFCCRVIHSHAPDVICLQEVREDQLTDFTAAFADFDAYGTADVPLGRDPVNTLFFRRDVFQKVSAATFWLSETPQVPGSSSWDSACIRLAGWVHLSERTSGRDLVVVNTHLDHRSQAARERQAGVINTWSAAFDAGPPIILTGDMNCDRRNPAIESYKAAGWCDTYEAVHGGADPGYTFHFFRGVDYVPDPANDAWWPVDQGKVDWIFTRGDVKVTGAEIVRDHENDRYPSDHFFVSADIEW